MNKAMFSQNLKKYFNASEQTLELFEIYKKFLQEENKKMNLTRLDDNVKIYQNYFWESLIPFIDVDLKDKNCLDIGSGSGVPGILLKILYPSIKLTILDANNKKINFMKLLAQELKINDISFVCQRAENVYDELYEYFDIVTSRAVASLSILLEISSPYAKIGGLVIEPKSINYLSEYELVKEKMNVFGLELKSIKEDASTKMINTFYFMKVAHCQAGYPRKWQEIIKDK